MKRYKSKICLLLIILIFGGITGDVVHRNILLAIGDFLVIKDKLHKADIIHVLAGEDHRTLYGIHLYKKGYGKLLFFTGGWCKYHKEFHGERAREISIRNGIPANAIITDDSKVMSTYEEAIRLKKFIKNGHILINSVIVVSDSFHMRRARWAYRNILKKNVKIQMAPVPFDLSPYNRIWWHQEKSREFVKNEYIKIVYYYVRYQISSGRLKRWLASLDID